MQEAAQQTIQEMVTASSDQDSACVEKLETDGEQVENGGSVYKLSVRDGKQVISRFPQTPDGAKGEVAIDKKIADEEGDEVNDNEEKKREKSSHDKSKHKSSKSSSKSSSKDKYRDKEKSSSSSKDKKGSSSSSSKNSSSSSSSKDKDRKDRKDKDKQRSNGSLKSSSSSSSSSKSKEKDKEKKESKEKQAEKDKDTLSKVLPQNAQKLARIPKKQLDEKSKENTEKTKDIKKDKNFSIEPRKPGEERPRTVKVFNAKMRSTGLEEEVKPPPPRTGKKPTPSVTLPSIPQKRPSPAKELVIPEKKPKIEVPERPGAIKLIPPKPKRKFSQYAYLKSFVFFRWPRMRAKRANIVTFILNNFRKTVPVFCFSLFTSSNDRYALNYCI